MNTINFNSSTQALGAIFGLDLTANNHQVGSDVHGTTAGFSDSQLQSINLAAELDGWLSMVDQGPILSA